MSKNAIFNKKNILITGGAGFIGSHLCDEIIKEAKVICLDNFSSGDEKNIDHLLAEEDFEFIRHDISEPIDLESLPELKKFHIEFQGIQEIYNLACPTSPRDFEKNRIQTIMANSIGTKNVLDLAVKYNSKLMHFSSSVIYGSRQEGNEKVTEDYYGQVNPVSERSCYDEGKRFAETMVVNYKKVYKIDAKILRLFRIYGPRMKLADGHMIPDFIDNALDNKDLIIFGDKNFSSSFCYVSDCIDATVKFMKSDLSGPFNVGSDVDYNLTKIAENITAALNSKSKVVYTKEMLFMTPLCLPSVEKIRQKLGWMPIVTMEKGLEKTVYELRAAKGIKNLKSLL